MKKTVCQKNLLALMKFSCVLLLTFIAPSIKAAPGDLDSSFGGGDGWTSTGFEFAPASDTAFSLIQQMDGRLVAVGVGANDDFALVRYNGDGSLDTSFNGTGKLTTAIGAAQDSAESVIQQADGKLVVAGASVDGNYYDVALARYNSDGSLDTTFNATGKLTTSIGAADDAAESVIQQADGKLVVAGYSNNGSNKDFALVRYNNDGSLDTSFNGTGKVTTAIGGADDLAASVIQQADGKLVVAGSSYSGSNYDFALVRYNSDGSLDTSFNGTGKLTTAIGTSNDYGTSLIQQADGKLVLVGIVHASSSFGAPTDIGLARYNSDGSLDTNFKGVGKFRTDFGSESAYSVIQQVDGKLVVAGRKNKGGANNDFELVRYNSDGSLDTGFNGTGELTIAVSTGNNAAYAIIQQSDGKLVAAGFSSGDFALLRCNADGSLDTTFSDDGMLSTGFYMSSGSIARSLIQQEDGKLVAAGYSRIGFTDDFVLARYSADGSLDAAFDTDGVVTTAIGASHDYAYSVIQQVDGKLVVAGSSYNGSNYDFALVRYLSDGSLDTSFDGDGKVATAISSSGGEAKSVIQQTDGKLVVAGYINNAGNQYFALVRYHTDGSLDTTFDGDGKVATAIGASQNYAYSLIQQADGKLLAVGSSYNGLDYDFALVRYKNDGSLDATFDGDGKVTTTIGAFDDRAYSVIQQADGKLVVAGSSYNGSNDDFALVRYNGDGSLDTTFDGDGKATAAIGASAQAYSVIQQADGKLVAAGGVDNGSNYDFALVRYRSDGPLDTTFGSDGKVIMAFGESYSVIQQADGKLVAASYSNRITTGQGFVVARFESGQAVPDSDGDGVPDVDDAFPFDLSEWLDTDGDGVGNNADHDDDGDGTPDVFDLDPLDSSISEDDLPLNGNYRGSRVLDATYIH